MHEQQLQELRREKWRLNGQALRTIEDAREFIDSVGFCLLYPQRPPVLAPTFVGAYKGSDEKLPTVQKAFADPRAREAKELMVRLLREKSAYETNVFPDNNFMVSASVFPYFYGLVGDRNPRQPPKAGARSGYSPLAVDAFHIVEKEGPISKQRLRELLGGDISEAALDRALDELWAKLRITRVDYKQDEGVFWDVLFRWSPEAVKEGMHVSVAEALTALVSKYIDCVLAAHRKRSRSSSPRSSAGPASAKPSTPCRPRVSWDMCMSAAESCCRFLAATSRSRSKRMANSSPGRASSRVRPDGQAAGPAPPAPHRRSGQARPSTQDPSKE